MRRTIVPPEITRILGTCKLTRQGAVRVFAALHEELPTHYSRFRRLRHPQDDQLFFFFVAVADDRWMHTFTFHIDDTTSAEHLILKDIEHETRTLEQ